MLLVLKFGADADIVDVPEIIIENLNRYQEQFTAWLFDKSVDHSYCGGMKMAKNLVAIIASTPFWNG